MALYRDRSGGLKVYKFHCEEYAAYLVVELINYRALYTILLVKYPPAASGASSLQHLPTKVSGRVTRSSMALTDNAEITFSCRFSPWHSFYISLGPLLHSNHAPASIPEFYMFRYIVI